MVNIISTIDKSEMTQIKLKLSSITNRIKMAYSEGNCSKLWKLLKEVEKYTDICIDECKE